MASLAARNNALWCNAVCRAHGQPTEFIDKLWICRGKPPRFYSSAVAIEPGAADEIVRLMPGGFKDSYYDIDGAALGYSCLFEATWICSNTTSAPCPQLNWKRVDTDRQLSDWEEGWAFGDSEAANFPRQFPPSLLKDPSVAFMEASQNNQMTAGCVLNLTGDVVGVSNVFILSGSPSDLWDDLPAVCASLFSERHLVGYERGQDLEIAIASGFHPVGPLRVWVSG